MLLSWAYNYNLLTPILDSLSYSGIIRKSLQMTDMKEKTW